jgi:hypothetical protein
VKAITLHAPALDPFGWVTEIKTVDAIETSLVDALVGNPGWRLLHVGTGGGGQTTLTFGWPWEEPE